MKYTRTEAFGSMGIKLTNPRWSHCGRSAKGDRVAITCWQDKCRWEKNKIVYEDRVKQDNGPGARELARTLEYVRDRLDGIFNVVMTVAEDSKSDPRRIKECYPRKFVMRLVRFDPNTGHFRAEAKAA